MTCSASRTKERPDIKEKQTSPRPAAPVSTNSPPRRAQQSTLQVMVNRTEQTDSQEEPHRRRKLVNTSPRTAHSSAHNHRSHHKLYNPNVDPVPMRRTAEPEVLSDNGSSAYASRNAMASPDRGAHQGRLFDYRKDDPVRFHVLRPDGVRATPTPKSSGDYVSASSTSSYAHSITSSNFTLNSTTDGSSASSALFDEQPKEHQNSSAFAAQLKKLYRQISNLEARLMKEDGREPADEGRITLKRANETVSDPQEAEKEKWRKFVADHKLLVAYLLFAVYLC